MAVNVPITFNWDAVDALAGNFGKPVDGIYTGPAIANVTTVLIADSNAVAGSTLTGYQSSEASSIAQYGTQAGRALVTLLAAATDASALAEYLQRPVPDYWFSDIEIAMLNLTAGQRTTLAALEIGDYIRVSKRFPNVAAPVVEDLAVEGIEHQITPSGHVVRLSCSPVVIWTNFILNTSTLDTVTFGLG